MDKPPTILRQLHPCGPNYRLLNQVGEDLANLRELVPKLESLRQEDPDNDLWQRRWAEATEMLQDYEVRYNAMAKVREKALRNFRRLHPTLAAGFIRKSRDATRQRPLKPELEERFQSLIEELEDLVFEFSVTEKQDELKRDELLALVDTLAVQVEMIAHDLGLDKVSAGIRDAALQIAKIFGEDQAAKDKAAIESKQD